MFRSTPILCLLALAGTARAQVPDDRAHSLKNLLELMHTKVITASKRPEEVAEAPGVVDVLTRKQVDLYGWTNLNEVLAQQPGFGPAQDYDRHTVSSRGVWESWNNNHLLLLVDGVPMNDNTYGTAFTWDITPLFMMKTLEVMRGPGSALYGSNATNGALTLNTLSAADLQPGGELRTRFGVEGGHQLEWVGGVSGDGLFSAVLGYALRRSPGNEGVTVDGSGRGVDAAGVGTLETFRTQDRHGSSYAWLKLEGQRALQGLTIQFHDQAWDYQSVYGWAFWVPDQREALHEDRQLLSLVYRPEGEGPLKQEYVLRWQAHGNRWNLRFYPNDAFGGAYPAGATEFLESSVQDLFGRIQFSHALPGRADLLFGLEADRTIYTGDRAHTATFDPDTGAANPNGEPRPLGPWLEVVGHHPLVNIAPYLQLSSGGWFGPRLKATLGARYDRAEVTLEPGALPRYAGLGSTRRTFAQFNPRLALVYQAREDLSLKLLAGKAFRAPSLAEIGGAHTYVVGAEPVKLRPEKVTTAEAALDWKLNPYFNWRINAFHTRYEDFISSSTQNLNYSDNIFSLTTWGLESELLAAKGRWSGYLNGAYARRVDEAIGDPAIALSRGEVTWEPSVKFNLGLVLAGDGLEASLSAHYQGPVRRRTNEVGVQTLILGVNKPVDLDRYRPRTLGSWVTVDGKVTRTFTNGLSLSLGGTNLTGTRRNVLPKNGPFPFDYPQEGRRGYLGLTYRF